MVGACIHPYVQAPRLRGGGTSSSARAPSEARPLSGSNPGDRQRASDTEYDDVPPDVYLDTPPLDHPPSLDDLSDEGLSEDASDSDNIHLQHLEPSSGRLRRMPVQQVDEYADDLSAYTAPTVAVVDLSNEAYTSMDQRELMEAELARILERAADLTNALGLAPSEVGELAAKATAMRPAAQNRASVWLLGFPSSDPLDHESLDRLDSMVPVVVPIHPTDQGSHSVETVFGKCERKRVIQDGTELFRISAGVCYIEVWFAWSTTPGFGTGFLIDKNIIATAAHVLYDKDTGSYATAARVYVGINGVYDEEIQVRDGEAVAVNHAYLDFEYGGMVKNDSGLLYFSNPVCDVAPLRCVSTTSLMQSELQIVIPGYAWDLDDKEMYSSAGPVLEDDGEILRYELDTEKGTSGAPIITYYRGSYVAIAIHSSGKTEYEDNNRAAMIGQHGNELAGMSSALVKWILSEED